MIGGARHRPPRRLPRVAGVAAIVVTGILFAARPAGAGSADPALVATRAEHVRELALEADAALGRLAAALEFALDAGRRGTARVVNGSAPPAPLFHEAAARVLQALDAASAAGRAVHAWTAALAAAGDATSAEAVPTPAELISIAGQLEDAADAARPFVKQRLASQATLEAMDDALAALDRDDPIAALAALETAGAQRRVVAAWDPPPATLRYWLRTVGKLIGAAEHVARATLDRDPAEARRAAAAYRRAADDAHRADIALAIAISESGSGIAATPLARLAAAARATSQAQAEVASVLHR